MPDPFDLSSRLSLSPEAQVDTRPPPAEPRHPLFPPQAEPPRPALGPCLPSEPQSWTHPGSQLLSLEEALHAPHTHSATPMLSFEAS